MRTITKTRLPALFAVILAAAGLSACGHTVAPSAGAPAPSAARSGTAAPAPHPSTGLAPSPRRSGPPSPAERVISARVSYPWHWPNDPRYPGSVAHSYQVPPVPRLVTISAGDHPGDPGEIPYNRLSFTFTTAFPSYQVKFVDALVTGPSGRTVPLAGHGVLQVTFRQAQAHAAGGRPTVVTQPPRHLGFARMISWAPGGDFEGVLTYGIGIDWPVKNANPQFRVRTIEVEKAGAAGQHRYVVAIDIDATQPDI